MAESHASLRDDYEVSCPEVDLLVRLAQELGSSNGVKQLVGRIDLQIRRVAEGEGNVLTRVRTLLWMVTFAALLAAALAVGASAAASVTECSPKADAPAMSARCC